MFTILIAFGKFGPQTLWIKAQYVVWEIALSLFLCYIPCHMKLGMSSWKELYLELLSMASIMCSAQEVFGSRKSMNWVLSS